MRWLLRNVRRFFESLWLPLVAAVAVAVLTVHVLRVYWRWPSRHETAFHLLLAAPPVLMLLSLVFLCFAKRWGRVAGATVLSMVFVLLSSWVFVGVSFTGIFEEPGPPRSIDLPLDGRRDRAVRRFLEAWHERDWVQWDVDIVTYVQWPDCRCVEVWYFYETAGASGSDDQEFLFADGCLAPQYWFTRNGPVVPAIESPLEWPVLAEVDGALRNEVARLTASYSEALRQELACEGEFVVEVQQTRYCARFKDDRWAGITAVLSVRGERLPLLNPRLDFDYADGKFRL